MLHSDIAETSVLGAIIQKPELVQIVEGIVSSDKFYAPVNGKIFEAIVKESKTGSVPFAKIIDAVASHTSFKTFSDASQYIYSLIIQNEGISPDVAIQNAYYIAETHGRRMGKELSAQLAKAYEDGNEVLADDIKSKLDSFSVKSKKKPDDFRQQVLKLLQSLEKGGNRIKTGLKGWDDAFGGLTRGSRYIIAAHGGAGKTAMACTIGWNLSRKGLKVKHLVFEEESQAMIKRVLSRELKIPMNDMMTDGPASSKTLGSIVQGMAEMGDVNYQPISEATSLADMIEMCGTCDLIIVDGVSSFPSPPEYTKVDKAGYVSDQCVKLAKITGATIIMLSHVNSESLKSGPSMTGVYGGQAATFDPEGILEIRRANPDEYGDYRTISGLVLKNRYGPVGIKMEFTFHGSTMTFYEKDNQYER